MTPRALLINPWIHDFAAYDFWQKPLGLLELGSWLRAAGYNVRLVDCLDVFYPGRTQPLPKRKPDHSGKYDAVEIPKPPALRGIARRFKRYGMPVADFRRALCAAGPPDVVLVSSVMTYWYTGVAETIGEVRRAFPQAPVILGGVYATLLPEHALAHTAADYVAVGDFQESLPRLLVELGLPAEFPRGEFFPAWDLYHRLDSAALLTGRGCNHRCPYCAVHALHPRRVPREPVRVLEELARLAVDYGVRDIALFDDALRAGGDEHLAAILEGIVRQGLNIRLHTINAMHLKGLTRELAELLKRGGVSTLRFGLETTDPERAKRLGGKADMADLHHAVRFLRQAGYAPAEIGVYLLAGLPGQHPAEIEAGIREVLAAGARPYLTEYSPVPQSPMWEEALQAARLDIAAEPLYHNNTLLPCADPALDQGEFSRLKALTREKPDG